MRQRPTLPGRLQPSTIGVLRLNFCVRNGNRWNPQAITTASGEQDCGGRSVSVLLFQALFSAESSPAFSGSSLSSGLLSLTLFRTRFRSSQDTSFSCSPSFRPVRFPFFPVSRLSGSPFIPFSGTPGLPSCILTTVYEFEINLSFLIGLLLKIN